MMSADVAYDAMELSKFTISSTFLASTSIYILCAEKRRENVIHRMQDQVVGAGSWIASFY